jgi:hypothetical protein
MDRVVARDRGARGLTLLVALVVLLSRLPFLGHGYGGDADAWRAIQSAQRLVETGTYVPSRPPGFPLPEYVDAVMLYVGLGSATGIDLISAFLSGVAAALFFRLLLPLGRSRATAGTLAMSFTPVVYVAGLGAKDYMWGLAFFLAATLCVLSSSVWLCAVFLGLAAASRASYALAIIPLALLHIGYDLGELRKPVIWRQLAALSLCSGLIALIFFLPAFLEIGVEGPTIYRGPTFIAYNASLGLFGIIGFIGVAIAVVLAWFNKRQGIPLPNELGRGLNGWAVTVLLLFGLLFVLLPDEASYLIPSLLGLYWLLSRYAPHYMLWVLVPMLLVSCFFLRLGHTDEGAVRVTMKGPVLREIDIQHERRCVGTVVERRLTASPDNLDYVIVGWYQAQLQVELGAPLSDHILYTLRPGGDGRLLDMGGVSIPDNARLLLLDRATAEQNKAWPLPEGKAEVLDSYQYCAPRS